MRILHVGPVIGEPPQDRIRITVETDTGHKVDVHLFHDWAASQTVENLMTALKAVLRLGPKAHLRELQGVTR